MRAYEGAFSEEETRQWLDRQVQRYHDDGHGLWAVVHRDSGEMIGQCGITRQRIDLDEVVEVGYLFERAHWHRGYAVEAASACRDWAFATLPIFLLWIYLSWLVVLMGATVASLLPALRLHRWALQRQVGAQAVDALGILRILWHARGSQPPGRSLSYLEKHLRVHPDALHDMLRDLRELGYVVPEADSEQWVLACDPARTDIGPLVDRLLINRAQTEPGDGTLEALSRTLLGHPPVLDALFSADSTENRDDDAQ